jgi:DNA ligase-1
MYAQRTNGGPVCTFGVWRADELVPVAKVESELTETERFELEKFIWENTTGRSGPVRIVKPELVFEIAFDEVQASTRRKAGLVLHSPRIVCWRKDQSAHLADTMETLQGLLPSPLGERPA